MCLRENINSKIHGPYEKLDRTNQTTRNDRQAFALAYGYLTGVENISQLADPDLFVRELMFATCMGLAFLARYCWMRWVNGPTRLPASAPVWERGLSKLAHNGIYIGVALIVLSGLTIAYGYATPSLGRTFVFAATEFHEFALAATAILLLAHVGGALWHKLFRHDGIWESMLFKRRSKMDA
jgi:cytochrome b561